MSAPASASGRWVAHRLARSGRSLLQVMVGVLIAAMAPAASAQEASEASVKAAYLYKFLAYVEWPPASFASADAPQVIAVLGADEVHASLQQLVAGRRFNGHPLEARKVARGDSLEGVHVLYVGPGGRPASILPALSGQPVLVVTDARNGLAEGGALNFMLVDGRVRFEAAPGVAERSGLKLSARLLAVAERVVTP